MENENQTSASQRRNDREIDEIVDQWRESSKSKTLFALENNLNYHTFYGWVKQRNKKLHFVKEQKKSERSGFVALKIKPAQVGLFAELNFPGGIKISLHQTVPVDYLKELIR